MAEPATVPSPAFREDRLAILLFALLLGFHGWAVSGGWNNGNLPGNEFRQTQTAISALFIQRDADFSLAYPTPVLGAPWSIPMEFPLYQWTVVGVSNLTGLPLIQAGRAVSLGCFYAALAALFPLLGRLGLAPARRLIVMGLLLTCPLYIFFARAFLIETMVLMFSLWFLVAFGRLITAPRAGLLALVTGLGILAGLVKVTSFMVFLMLAGLWAAWEMRRSHTAAGWPGAARRGAWALAAICVPVAATALWTRFADAVKAQNLSASFIESGSLVDFNFGTAANRFSAATLGSHWHNATQNVAGIVLLAAAALLALSVSRRWWRQMALLLGCYLASLALFPTLYAWHDYYAVTNAVLLLGAVGVAVAGALEGRGRWLPWAVLLGLHASQVWTYHRTYQDLQRAPSPGGSDMTHAINLMTDSGEVLVVAGYDWDSSVPFYSGRRALMLRRDLERDPTYLEAACKAQDARAVTVFVVRDVAADSAELHRLMAQYFDIDPRPLFRWADSTVYGRKALRGRMTDAVRRGTTLVGVALDASTGSETWSLTGREVLTADLLAADRVMLAQCHPLPWKLYAQFGARTDAEAGRPALFAHPDTRLWFKVPAGPQVLSAECGVKAAAWAGAAGDRTDGVEFFVDRELADGTRERLGSLLLDPARRPADGGLHLLKVAVNFPTETTLVLATGPGPAQNYTRDWAVIGRVTIE